MPHTTCRPAHWMMDQRVRHGQMRADERSETRLAEPVVSISRLPGCGGHAIAQELAARIGYALYDKEILENVSERSHMPLSEVRGLDEKVGAPVEEWLESLILQRCPSTEYFWHLSKTLLAIAERGRAVIVGRGAAFILPPKTCLRVLLVAPLKTRIQSLADRMGLSLQDSRERICRVEADRRAFIMKHFHREMTDPTQYDIVLNTEVAGGDCAVDAIRTAWTSMCEHRLSMVSRR